MCSLSLSLSSLNPGGYLNTLGGCADGVTASRFSHSILGSEELFLTGVVCVLVVTAVPELACIEELMAGVVCGTAGSLHLLPLTLAITNFDGCTTWPVWHGNEALTNSGANILRGLVTFTLPSTVSYMHACIITWLTCIGQLVMKERVLQLEHVLLWCQTL